MLRRSRNGVLSGVAQPEWNQLVHPFLSGRRHAEPDTRALQPAKLTKDARPAVARESSKVCLKTSGRDFEDAAVGAGELGVAGGQEPLAEPDVVLVDEGKPD